MKKALVILWMLATLAPALAQAGERVSLRLVRADNEAGASSPSLGSLVQTLQRNLPYRRFTEVSANSLPLPGRGGVPLGELRVFCRGPQDNLSVTVKRAGNTLVQTRVRLRDGQPVIVGGFPDGQARLLIVLVSG